MLVYFPSGCSVIGVCIGLGVGLSVYWAVVVQGNISGVRPVYAVAFHKLLVAGL